MQTEPRLPELLLEKPTPAAPTRERLGAVLARLDLTGYRIDRQKWERFEEAGLVSAVMPTERGEREAIKRLRRLLDVERRLQPTGDLDALCFHLAAAGIDDVPATSVARHIAASVRSLLAVGDGVAREIALRPDAVAAPEAERRAASTLARQCLGDYTAADRVERRATEAILGAAFIAYLRSVSRASRPGALLHESSRLVTLDDVSMPARAPRHSDMLPPLASGDAICAWLGERVANAPPDVPRAVHSVAAMFRLTVRRYPELQIAWRDVAAAHGSSASRMLAALSAAPGVLSAALLQVGELPRECAIEDAPLHLMHQWGATLR